MAAKNLIGWLKERPAISIRKLEEESKIPSGTLYKYLKGYRGIPDTAKEKLIPILRKYRFDGTI